MKGRGTLVFSKPIKMDVPLRIIFYDTESKKEPHPEGYLHKFLLGYMQHYEANPRFKREKGAPAYELVEEMFFYEPMQFFEKLDSISRNTKTLYVFSHNQHFDFNAANGWKLMELLGYTFYDIIIDSDLFIVKATKNLRTIVFLDTANYFRTSVGQLGLTLGLEKIEVDFERASMEELKARCKRDVEIIARAMLTLIEWWARGRYGAWGYTVASLAFNAFRARFMTTDITRTLSGEEQKFELASYRGGRVEAFKLGRIRGPVYALDVNSMYPFVMASYEYPTVHLDMVEGPSVEWLRKALDEYAVLADVHFTQKEPGICVKRDYLICPVGNIRAVLTTPELVYLFHNGRINKVYRAKLYEKDIIFDCFVNHFYNLRKKWEAEGNKAYAYFAKLVMNSLYGKFAQRIREMIPVERPYPEEYSFMNEIDLDSYGVTRVYRIGSKWYQLAPTEEYALETNIAIASHITAYARMVLWSYVNAAGRENVYYVDTDALFVNQTGYENLKSYMGEGLGELKINQVCRNMIIYGLKDYMCDAQVKLKGVPKEAVLHSSGYYVYPQFLKTKSLLLKGITGAVLEKIARKQLNRRYEKGIVREDGRVEPFVLDDPQ